MQRATAIWQIQPQKTNPRIAVADCRINRNSHKIPGKNYWRLDFFFGEAGAVGTVFIASAVLPDADIVDGET